jgi:hypothetical protein
LHHSRQFESALRRMDKPHYLVNKWINGCGDRGRQALVEYVDSLGFHRPYRYDARHGPAHLSTQSQCRGKTDVVKGVQPDRASDLVLLQTNNGSGSAVPADQTVDDGGASPPAQYVQQRQSGPRQSHNIDIRGVFELVLEDSGNVDSDTIVSGDLVAESDDYRGRRGAKRIIAVS